MRSVAEKEWTRTYNSQKKHAKQSINDKAELELMHNATVDEINKRLDKLRKARTDKDALIDEIMSRTDIDEIEKFALIANAGRNAAAATSYIPVLEKELERRGAEPQPTEAQIAAGNYKKGHVKIDGYDITIENPKGSVRRGKNSNGTAWEIEMQNDYGYIRRTEGVDGDHIDIFLSDNPKSGDVFVVDQVNPNTGEFDEHKVMYGFPNEEAARDAYLSNYSKGWNGLGKITRVSKEEFKKWIDSSHRKTKPFAEYRSVTPIENSVIGRSLSEHEATELIKQMETNAEIAPILELTAENWKMEFGEYTLILY